MALDSGFQSLKRDLLAAQTNLSKTQLKQFQHAVKNGPSYSERSSPDRTQEREDEKEERKELRALAERKDIRHDTTTRLAITSMSDAIKVVAMAHQPQGKRAAAAIDAGSGSPARKKRRLAYKLAIYKSRAACQGVGATIAQLMPVVPEQSQVAVQVSLYENTSALQDILDGASVSATDSFIDVMLAAEEE